MLETLQGVIQRIWEQLQNLFEMLQSNEPVWQDMPLGVIVLMALILLVILIDVIVIFARRSKRRKKAPVDKSTLEEPPPLVTEDVPVTPKPTRYVYAGFQGIGERHQQQDAIGAASLDESQELLCVLCDGMGGLQAGAEIAAKTVEDILAVYNSSKPGLPQNWVTELRNINISIYEQYAGTGGTTLVLTYIKGYDLWYWCLGDSDLFLLRDGCLYAMNTRHEYQYDLFRRVLYDNLPIENALEHPQRSHLTGYMGSGDAVYDYSKRPYTLMKGDKLLLCSDGISDILSVQQLTAMLEADPPHACKAMENGIKQAAHPAQDNYSAYVIEVL